MLTAAVVAVIQNDWVFWGSVSKNMLEPVYEMGVRVAIMFLLYSWPRLFSKKMLPGTRFSVADLDRIL